MPKGLRGFQKGNTLGALTKGYPKSIETREKISKAKKGKPAWNKGKPSPWTAKRNRIDNRKRRDEKHWNWQGGKAKERHKAMGREEYKQWRSNVFQRDNWICQTCHIRGGYLEAHHIKGWAKYPELRYDLDNGVTLCLECHKLTDNYQVRGKQQN